MFVIFAFLIFSVAMFGAAYYVWAVPQQHEAEAVAARLRELRSRGGGTRQRGGSSLMRTEAKGTFSFLNDFFKWLGILRRLQELIDQANLKWRAVDIFGITIILFAGAYVFLGFTGLDMQLLRIFISALIAALPIFIILRIRKKRLDKFEEIFPDAIDLFNRSMKAGHTIHAGLDTIANESIDPIKMEFKKVTEEMGLGSQLDDALLNMGKRIPLIDLKFFITGLILQRQTGANMVEVLENLSLLVRERLNMTAKMKAHTSQQKLSAGMLCGLPIVVGTVFWIVRPEMMSLLITDDLGSMAFTYAIVSEIIGILIIRKLANPKF